MPTTVMMPMKIHQPLRPVSCSRLTLTARLSLLQHGQRRQTVREADDVL